MRRLMQRAAAAVVLGGVLPVSLLPAESVPDLGLSDSYQATAGQVAPDLGLVDNYSSTAGGVAPDLGLDNNYDYQVADEDQALFDDMANAADPLGAGPQYQTSDQGFNAWSSAHAYIDPLRKRFRSVVITTCRSVTTRRRTSWSCPAVGPGKVWSDEPCDGVDDVAGFGNAAILPRHARTRPPHPRPTPRNGRCAAELRSSPRALATTKLRFDQR